MKQTKHKYDLIVIGTSAGGLNALTEILSELSHRFPIPILVVQHRMSSAGSMLEDVLQSKCELIIKQADEKHNILPGKVYIAPSDYHLLVEENGTLSLSSDEKVCFSRPSIDVLFESAAYAYRERLLGIVLTGANQDGANGVRAIRAYGGSILVQDPAEAAYSLMPDSAIETGCADIVLTLKGIAEYLKRMDYSAEVL